jgi:TRAP transporter 4TM/12TM fusion protein
MSEKPSSFFYKNILAALLTFLSIAMVGYQLLVTQYLFLPYDVSKILHLGFALVLVFLSLRTKTRMDRIVVLSLTLCAAAATLYFVFFFDDLIMRIGLPTKLDIVVAVILVVSVIEGTRRAFGLVLPIFCLVWVLYAFLGHLLPEGWIYVPYLGAERIITKMALDFNGIYGAILGISFSYIFLFIIFGSLMKETGTVKFFEQVGKVSGSALRGGTAISAISTSALFGMVTGSASSNVVLTGSFTIPAMKKAGFSPATAGGVEASASTVGQVMPPVMGAAAFLMADFLEMPYVTICWMALLPSLLTYLCMALNVQLYARKRMLAPPASSIDYGQLLRFSYLFIVPLFILILLLAKGYSPNFAIFWTIILLVALCFIRKETRLPLNTWVKALVEGAVMGSGIAVMCGAIGIVVSVIIMSGLPIKLPAAIESISADSLIAMLLLTMAATLLLGCGMPTTAAYMLVALVVTPALTKAGLDPVAAHFFVFYFACFSLVTPPVAPAAVTASALAKSSFFRTGLEATKVSIAAFILPFFMFKCPVLFLRPENFWKGVTDIVGLMLLLLTVQVALVGAFFTECNMKERMLATVIALILGAYLYSGDNLSLFGPLALSGFFLFIGVHSFRSLKVARVKPSGAVCFEGSAPAGPTATLAGSAPLLPCREIKKEVEDGI